MKIPAKISFILLKNPKGIYSIFYVIKNSCIKKKNILSIILETSRTIGELYSLQKRGYQINYDPKTKKFETIFKGFKICSQHLKSLLILLEDLESNYIIPSEYIRGKNIIDIGGYLGETAFLFKALGAKKIFVFEPNPEIFKDLMHNIVINSMQDFIIPYQIAITSKNGYVTFKVDEDSIYYTDFGLKGGPIKIKAKSISWENLVKLAIKENVTVIKADCEGCEKYVTDVKDNLLKKIPYWIIECHSYEIANKVYLKFINAGFKLKKKINLYPGIFIFHFQR